MEKVMSSITTQATSNRATSQSPYPISGVPGDVPEIDALCINTIRTLSMDAVQAAKSGHPGTPMALAPVAYTLWQEFLRFDPANPLCPGRDRFVLSNGHAGMLLYSLLYLTKTQAVNSEYQLTGKPSLTIEDIKGFRQIQQRIEQHSSVPIAQYKSISARTKRIRRIESQEFLPKRVRHWSKRHRRSRMPRLCSLNRIH